MEGRCMRVKIWKGRGGRKGVEGGEITIKIISDGGLAAGGKRFCEYPPPCFLASLSPLSIV
jgi:hypothetical protein